MPYFFVLKRQMTWRCRNICIFFILCGVGEWMCTGWWMFGIEKY